MSRFESDYESEIPRALMERWTDLAVNGRPGQRWLRRLEAALVAMPEKRLTDSVFVRDGSVCALGALAVHGLVEAGARYEDALCEAEARWGSAETDQETIGVAKKLGMTASLAWDIAYANDEVFWGLTPEERWEKMLSWVRERIKPGTDDGR